MADKITQDTRFKLKFSEAEWNNITLTDRLVIDYMDVAMKIYKYKGLPDSVPEWVIERCLFWYGMVVFFKDDTKGYLALPPVVQSYLNVYGLPQVYAAQGVNGDYFDNLDETNSVIIKNTPNYVPTYPEVYRLCSELANTYITRTINVNATKTPFIFSGDEKELLSMKNMYKKITGNEPVIYKNKNGAQSTITLETLDTNAEYYADKLTDLKNDIKCELLTYLGLNNNNIEKKERLVTSEVSANNEIISNYLYMRLDERKAAIEKINALFGLDISVDINKDTLREYGILADEQDDKEQTEVTE